MKTLRAVVLWQHILLLKTATHLKTTALKESTKISDSYSLNACFVIRLQSSPTRSSQRWKASPTSQSLEHVAIGTRYLAREASGLYTNGSSLGKTGSGAEVRRRTVDPINVHHAWAEQYVQPVDHFWNLCRTCGHMRTCVIIQVPHNNQSVKNQTGHSERLWKASVNFSERNTKQGCVCGPDSRSVHRSSFMFKQ